MCYAERDWRDSLDTITHNNSQLPYPPITPMTRRLEKNGEGWGKWRILGKTLKDWRRVEKVCEDCRRLEKGLEDWKGF